MLRVAAQIQRAPDDGMWLIELGELHDPTLVAHTVATILGLREWALLRLRDQSQRPSMGLLTEYFAERQVLLVLDNCGYLVGAVAKLVDALVRSCPGIRVLVTSRERLGVGGEVTPPVPGPRPQSLRGLSQAVALALFAERAAAVVPEFRIQLATWITDQQESRER